MFTAFINSHEDDYHHFLFHHHQFCLTYLLQHPGMEGVTKPSFMSPYWSTLYWVARVFHSPWRIALKDVLANPRGYRNSPLCPDRGGAAHFFLDIWAYSLWQIQWSLSLPVALIPEYPGSSLSFQFFKTTTGLSDGSTSLRGISLLSLQIHQAQEYWYRKQKQL